MKATVTVQWLQQKLEENRAKHLATFEKAWAAFRIKAIEQMERNLQAARRGEEPNIYVALVKPMNQTGDYDRVLAMLDAMKIADVNLIDISEEDFNCYVLDKWNWKSQFSSVNTTYGVVEE